MTKKQDTADQEARKRRAVAEIETSAVRRFGQAIFNAARAYEDELKARTTNHPDGVKNRDIHPGKDFEEAREIASFLGFAFLDPPLSGDARQTLNRISAALRPPTNGRESGQAIELAEEIVRKYAEIHQRLTPGDSHPTLPAPFETPPTEQILVIALANRVHPGFKRLRGKRAEIRSLLDRFSTSKGRKAKKGQPTKLAAAGILCELNKMAGVHHGTNKIEGSARFGEPVVTGTPLKDDLTPNDVASAIKRFRITPVQ